MKYTLCLLIGLLFTSCSSIKRKIPLLNAIRNFNSESYKLDCSSLSAKLPVFVDGSVIALSHLNGGEPDRKKLTPVDTGFYIKYILPNKESFNVWNTNNLEGIGMEDHEKIWHTEHYLYGVCDRKDSLCWLIIYEYYIVNHDVNRLKLMGFSSTGELVAVQDIAESTIYPGAPLYSYSVFSKDTLTTYTSSRNYDTDLNTNQQFFEVDSSVEKFMWYGRDSFVKVEIDTFSWRVDY